MEEIERMFRQNQAETNSKVNFQNIFGCTFSDFLASCQKNIHSEFLLTFMQKFIAFGLNFCIKSVSIFKSKFHPPIQLKCLPKFWSKF